MKQSCEKTKVVTETFDIGMFVAGSPKLMATKEGVNMKEPYEKPKMFTETIEIGTLLASTGGSPAPVQFNQPQLHKCCA